MFNRIISAVSSFFQSAKDIFQGVNFSQLLSNVMASMKALIPSKAPLGPQANNLDADQDLGQAEVQQQVPAMRIARQAPVVVEQQEDTMYARIKNRTDRKQAKI